MRELPASFSMQHPSDPSAATFATIAGATGTPGVPVCSDEFFPATGKGWGSAGPLTLVLQSPGLESLSASHTDIAAEHGRQSYGAGRRRSVSFY